MTLRVRRISWASDFGAEIAGIDLARPLPAGYLLALISAWRRHQLVILRDQRIGDAELLAFGSRLGWLATGSGDGDPARQTGLPVAGILLAGESVAEGDETAFLDRIAAYAALPRGLKKRIAALRIRQGSEAAGWRPLVAREPADGRPALMLEQRSHAAIEGLDAMAAKALLDELWEWAAHPDHSLRHRWRDGDVALWNNGAVLCRIEAVRREPLRRLALIQDFHPYWMSLASHAG